MTSGGSRRSTTRKQRAFLKLEGAGNDFVLLDDRRTKRRAPSAAEIRRLLDRRRGIGGDGLLQLVHDDASRRPRVRYWNSDGGAAAFCGNGARAVALILLGAAGIGETSFDFGRWHLVARWGRGGRGDRVALRVPVPKLLVPPLGAAPGGRLVEGSASSPSGAADRTSGRSRSTTLARAARPSSSAPSARAARPSEVTPAWVDAGVPHWIIPVASVDRIALDALAPPIRSWPALGPGGTNVDVVEIISPATSGGRHRFGTGPHGVSALGMAQRASGSRRGCGLRVRTWERGVEGETLACGSGLTACGWWAAAVLGLGYPVTLFSRGGDRFFLTEAGPDALWLDGPARIVFRGDFT